MAEREPGLKNHPGEEASSHLRLIRDVRWTDGGVMRGKWREYQEYQASTSEVLLEEICRSFGTELSPAYINPLNGAKLVRESQPVIVAREQNGQKYLFQFQSTRFSPLNSHREGVVAIYNQTAEPKRNRDWDEVFQEIDARIQERDGEFKPFLALTNRNYIPDVPLHRWPKTLYFAVFEVDEKEEVSAAELKPFLIHEHGSFRGKLPQAHIELHIEPYFVIRQMMEPTTRFMIT